METLGERWLYQFLISTTSHNVHSAAVVLKWQPAGQIRLANLLCLATGPFQNTLRHAGKCCLFSLWTESVFEISLALHGLLGNIIENPCSMQRSLLCILTVFILCATVGIQYIHWPYTSLLQIHNLALVCYSLLHNILVSTWLRQWR